MLQQSRADERSPDLLRRYRQSLRYTSHLAALVLPHLGNDQLGELFRDIAEEFAELIIPKVWENEGRQVARVAKRLSISPKKVRRALIRAGLLKHQASGTAAGE